MISCYNFFRTGEHLSSHTFNIGFYQTNLVIFFKQQIIKSSQVDPAFAGNIDSDTGIIKINNFVFSSDCTVENFYKFFIYMIFLPSFVSKTANFLHSVQWQKLLMGNIL